jgi:hypothetical protein
MKGLSTFLPVFVLLVFTISYPAPHVFWYKATTNGYALTQCNPGPCLDAAATVHEGIIATGCVAQHSGSQDSRIAFGSGLDDQQGRCSFIWSNDLNNATGAAASALFRAEYQDGWCGNALCNAGPINIRCGVVDFQGNLDTWGGADYVPETADWQDFLNPLSSSMGFDFMTPTLQSEEVISFTAPAGKQDEFSPSVLDGQFVEVDITDQVNWILQNSGNYAIVFLVPPNEGNTGKVSAYAYEDSPGVQLVYCGGDNPWTKDGNTAHIEIDGTGYPPPPRPPQISAVSPDSGDITGGYTVTISGNYFNSSTSVYFGSTAASSVQYYNSMLLSARVPAGPSNGPVNVVVRNSYGTDTLISGFSYFTNEPPVIQNVLTQSDTVIPEDVLYTLNINATDVNGHRVTYTLPFKPSTMTITSSGLISWVPPNSHVGTNRVMVVASDPFGGADTLDFNITVVNVNDPPIILSSPILVAYENQRYTYVVRALDVDPGDAITFSLLTGPSGLSMADSIITWTPAKSQVGDTVVSFRVSDTYGAADTQAYTLRVNAINDPPVFVSSPDSVVYEAALYVYLIETTDDENDTITYSLIAYPTGMSLSGDTLLWRPANSQVGTHTVILKASDGHGGNTNQVFTIRVINVPNIPEFTSIVPSGDTTIHEGDSVVFSVDAYDPDNTQNTLIYYWFVDGIYAGADSALARDKSYVLRTDYSSAGICSVRVLVFDGESQADHSWQVTIENVSMPPQIITPLTNSVVNSDSVISWVLPPDPDIDANTVLYRVEFSKGSGFDPLLLAADSLDKTSYRLSELVRNKELPELTVICVRVKAFDAAGYSTDFSDSSRSFLFLRYMGIEETENAVPESYVMHPNRPNPFNPATYIRFGVPEPVDRMMFRIFDIKGRLVRTVTIAGLRPGYHTFSWNGRDSRGDLCQNGVYVCKMHCGKFEKSIKMTMIK